ncbi:HEAT repeat domain-containing protein [Phormidium sp. FACHB-322]|nr:HEAT repeat domain-containing protein [Phormidium sp. FACHB-322]
MTCDHVIKALDANARALIDRQQRSFAEAAVVERRPQLDLALLQYSPLPDVEVPCVYLGEAFQPRDDLYTYGYPDSFLQGTSVTGVCEGSATENGSELLVFKLAQVRPGLSGAPLLNWRTGQVCGMIKFTKDRTIDLGGGAIPTRVILEQFPQLRDQQRQFHQANCRWHDLVTKPQGEVDFEPYLQALTTTYHNWWTHYTLTDATGRIAAPKPEGASPFDFGLMVKAAVKETDGPGSDPKSEEREKIERLPVLEGIRKYADNHVLLVGRPGSGKSTALIRLLLEEATQALQQGEGQVPILVELRYWNTSIQGLIQGFLQRHGLKLNDSTLSKLLGQGRFLLLIDGLNELPSESARTQLSAFRRNHPKVPMIFTTRDLGLGGDLGIEKKLEMQPLTEPQMKDFIRAYVPHQAESMLRQLNTRLREFGQTPLLLWMLCEVFQQSPNRQMPTNLAEVFRAFTTMYEDSSVRKHEVALLKGDVRPLSDRRLWKPALIALAALMMQGKTPVDFRRVIPRAEAKRKLGKIFAKEKFPVRDILDDLLKYHLLQNRTTDQLEFGHHLIQEYYAAEYLLGQLPKLSDEQLKRDYLNLLKWTEAIALMLSLVDDEPQALRVVKLAMDDVDLMLGARLAGEVKPLLQTKTIGWLDSCEFPTRLKVQCWAMSHSQAAIPGLLKAFEDRHFFVCLNAAETLGKIGGEAAISGLLKALDNQKYHVRRVVTEVLWKIGGEAAIPGLLKALEDQSSNIRGSAAYALAEIGSEAAIPGLLKALDDPNSDVREKVAYALAEIGNEATIPGFLKALDDPDSDVRERAAYPWEEIISEVVITELLSDLEDQSPDVRKNTAYVLGKIGSEAAISGLLKALDDRYSDVRGSAAYALGEIGGQAAIPGLLKALDDQYDYVYRTAAYALGKIGGEAAIPGLLKALEYPDSDVRRSAAHALGKIGGEAAIPGLLKIFEDPGSYESISATSGIRRSAADALGKICGEAAIPGLLKALDDQNYSARESAAHALGEIGSEAAIPGLLKALDDPNSLVRGSAADALGKIGAEAAIADLWQLHFRQPEDHLENAISAIQNRRQFYNHEIWQAYLAGKQGDSAPSQSDKTIENTVIIKAVEQLTIMSDKSPVFNQQHATIGVNYAAEGSQQDFTQHIHAPEQNFEILLTGYKHFIDELQQQNPHITNETAIIQTIDIEARRIDTRWQNFLNLKRLWNGGKKSSHQSRRTLCRI